MADNIAVTPGSGATVAADDVGGVLYQRIKLSVGADGSATDITSGAGAVAAGTPRVTLASDDPLVVKIGEVQASPTANTVLDRLKTIATNLGSVVLAAGSAVIGKVGLQVGGSDISTTNTLPVGKSFKSSVQITRPNDVVPYTANDVVGGVIEFANIGAANSYIMLTDVYNRIDLSAVPSGMANLRLHLYSATPPSALADNAAWDLPSGDRSAYAGYIDIGTPVDLGSTLWVERSGINKSLKLSTTSLYAYLVTIGAYTPTAQTVKTLDLIAMQIG